MTAVTAEQRRDGFEAVFNSAGTHTTAETLTDDPVTGSV